MGGGAHIWLSPCCNAHGCANIVWAVGTNGMILKTIDGTNWVHQDFSTTAELNGVLSFSSWNTAWAVGDDGLMIRTPLDGSAWVQQDSGVTVPLSQRFRGQREHRVGGGDEAALFSRALTAGRPGSSRTPA